MKHQRETERLLAEFRSEPDEEVASALLVAIVRRIYRPDGYVCPARGDAINVGLDGYFERSKCESCTWSAPALPPVPVTPVWARRIEKGSGHE